MSSWLHRVGVGAFFGLVAACSQAAAQDAESGCRDGTEPAQVIEACTQTLDPYGKPVWALIRRGHALLDDGQIEAGSADANLAVRAAAKNSDAHALLGRALRDAGDYDAALKSFDRAISLDNDNATAFFYRAQLHYWRDENELALEDIGQSVAIDEANLDFRYWRGVISDEAGDHETALKDFSWVIQNDPENPEYLDSRAWTYFTLGRFPESLGDIDKALALAPDMATPHETRGHVFYSSNRREDAAKELRKALEIDPERSMARQLLAWIDVTAPLPLTETDCGQLGFIRKKLAGLKVEVEGSAARAGEPLKVKWSVPDVAIRPDQPVYLVLTLPQDVRFEGHGFFALAPGARGPFGMEYGTGEMRTVTPLNTRGAARSGEISIVPYRAGALPVEWQVVQISACGEKTVLSKGNKATVDVAPGIPELVPLDEGAGGAPVAELRPVNGPFRATIDGNSVGVTNEESGETVLRVAGANPVFSPSGRFLLVQADNAEVNDVYDLVAVRKLGRFGPARLYWGQGDSFLFVDGIDGRMQVVRTLHGARFAPSEPVAVAVSDEDIVTPTGAQGPVPGSEAWDMELSVDSGVVAFGNGWRENAGVAAANDAEHDGEEGDTGAGADLEGGASAMNPGQGLAVTETGLIVPLGDPGTVSGPMAKYDLPARLIADYGVTRPAPIGWNNHDVLWQARLDAGPRTLGSGSGYVTPVSLATQSRSAPEGAAVVGEDGGAIRVRPGKRLPRPSDSSEAASTVAGVLFNHLGGERLATLRAGTDTRAIDHVERELNDVFPTSIAFFEPDESGTVPVQPIPSPYPYLQPEKASSIDLHKGPLDLWAGRAEGGERFWLSQAVVAKPDGSEARHSMTLLSTSPDGFLRYANLLPLANMVEAMRNLRRIDGDFDMRAAGGPGQPWAEPSTVTLTGGRYLTIVTRPVPHLLVFDLKEWRLVCGIARPRDPANVADVMFHADLGHVTQVNRSGQIEVYSCADGGPVLTAMYTDGELVVVDKSGHFEGSAEAASSVAVRLPGVPGRHVLSQFTSRLWVPDLAKRVLAGEAVDPATALDPPTLRLAVADGAGFQLTARSATSLAGIDLIADGRPLKYVEAKGKEAVVALGADELAGRGIVTAVATDKNGVASAPIELLPQRKAGQRAPKLFLLAVGIGSYRQMEGAELQYAAADATRLSKAVARSLYSNTSAVTLTDGDATQQAIMDNLGRMVAEAGADDIIMLSVAGQGLRGKDGSLRLGLTDTNLYEIEGTALDFAAVQAALAKAKARVVLLLDVSHASLVKRAEVATNEDVSGLLTSAPEAQMIVLSAARGAQASELTTTLSGGRVSVAIRDILVKDRASADTDANGNISVHELFRAAKAAVAQDSGGRQTPWIARGGIAGDFDIF